MALSFDLILTINNNETNSFRFVEIINPIFLPSIIVLYKNDCLINSSIEHIYQTESYENSFSTAVVFNRSSSILFAIVQISNGIFYQILKSSSLNDKFLVRNRNSIVSNVHVSIHWHSIRYQRIMKKPTKIISPKKSRHIYIELLILIDSLILYDARILFNRTELETIEILKLYYIHIIIGVEQLYRQSLINQTLNVHIRLSKIIFSTEKYRLPWESSKSNSYRKSPNHSQLRPNISMDILKILHQSYRSKKFDKYFFDQNIDHIMTFTRLNLINGAGSAYVSGLCSSLYKYSIIQEDFNLFSTMITVTHELGHNLGLNHDEIENECNDPKQRYIMSPKNTQTDHHRRQVPYFSKCSIKQLNQFADKTTSKCWKNRIISMSNETKFKQIRDIASNKLGQIINLRQQCQLQHGIQAVPFISVSFNESQNLYEETICNQLNCFRKLDDNFMYAIDGALDGTPCGVNRICYQKKCISNQKKNNKQINLDLCPYGDLFVPISMVDYKQNNGNMLCSNALNQLRKRGMNVTYLCYHSNLPYRRLCCEECKKHLVPECGDHHSKCSTFVQYCQNPFIRIDKQPITKLCPYTCGKCETVIKQPLKSRKYTSPKQFTSHTCIDMGDCSQLMKIYSKINKTIKNWCKDYSTKVHNRYFIEMCPKYCRLCNISSECDRWKLCRNNGQCIRNEYGTYQCLCSSTKKFYGTLCEYRRTCSSKTCSSKGEFCIQTQGEDYVCLSATDKEKLRIILN